MYCCLQALKDHSTLQDDRTEKQIVSLLTSLLTAHEPVTVLGLSTYPEVMGLLKPDAQKGDTQSCLVICIAPVPLCPSQNSHERLIWLCVFTDHGCQDC